MAENYYQVLGLQPEAGEAEIREAYKRLAKQWHPDVNPHKAEAEEKFKLINEAYSTLSDRTKRAYYDLSLFSTAFEEAIQQTPNTRRAPRTQSTRRRPPINPNSVPRVEYYFTFKTKVLSWLFIIIISSAFLGIIIGWANYSANKIKREAEILVKQKKYGRATEKYVEAMNLSFFKADVESAWELAYIHSEYLKNSYSAVEWFSYALKRNYPRKKDPKKRALTYRLISKNLLFQNKPKEAWEMISSAVEIDPDINLNFEYAAYFDLSQQYGEAEKYYKLALNENIEPDLAHLRLGKLLLQQERYVEAQSHFEQLLIKYEDNAELYYFIGLCQVKSGEIEQGCKTLRKAAEMKNMDAWKLVLDYCN